MSCCVAVQELELQQQQQQQQQRNDVRLPAWQNDIKGETRSLQLHLQFYTSSVVCVSTAFHAAAPNAHQRLKQDFSDQDKKCSLQDHQILAERRQRCGASIS